MRASTFVISTLSVLTLGCPAQREPRYERVYPLAPSEGVFAYSRISPSGRYLVYATEGEDARGQRSRAIVVIDLSSRRVRFSEAGIDAYWSPDGERLIYLSQLDGRPTVSIRNQRTGAIARDVVPPGLGDYFSWAVRDGRNLILTIKGNYYYLDGDRGVMPPSAILPCPGIGVGERPLISKDGRRVTTFVRGTVVIRGLTDCGDVFDTGLKGAKADFSFDGRYIAFHAPKIHGAGYDILIVDQCDHTVRRLTLSGSSLFPSWTRDGRLSFRYDEPDYRGFMMASYVLSVPAQPLPAVPGHVPDTRAWGDVFPETPAPRAPLALALVWSTWSAHAPDALINLQRARDDFLASGMAIDVLTATEPASLEDDIRRLIDAHGVRLRRIPLAAGRLGVTEADNQIPTTLLFRGTRLVDRRLGAQTAAELREWVRVVSAR